ncbi:cholesterol 24-hydroxylase-like isoform X1 [Acipenser ruthenus]|uniref:cholesterol 24-hydroxylase-like isoform X1 n=1 Tax=Acipenser ruthenus TaxID=7906 RepID=UPI002740C0EC|nr:cholesterol 24-hydroxylase-like isoform X1 [Acipenser ruthenus]
MSVLYIVVQFAGCAFLFVSLLLLGSFAAYCLYVQYIHMKFDHIPGPPRDSFLLGHGPALNKAMEGYKLAHDKFLEWTETYGPVYRVNVLHRVMLLVSSPDAVKEYLMSPKYPKDPYTYNLLFNLFGKRFLGKGLLTDPDDDHWYKQRRIMDPAFSRMHVFLFYFADQRYLKGMMGVFNEKAECLMEKLEEKTESQTPVSMHFMVNCVTLDVIAKVAFGMDLNLLDESKTPFPHAISTCLKGMTQYIQNPYMMYMPWHWKFVKEVEDSAELLRKTGKEYIEKRKRAVKNGEEVPDDILTQILKSAEQEGDYDDEVMLDNFITFFIAGQETTANQLSFTIMELTRQPEIMKKLRVEVDDVIGSKRDIDYEDLGKLTYLSQVLKESLRIYPPAPGTSRWIPEDTVIEGIHIPGGISATFNTYIMGRMEKFFKDPLKFDPERFHPDAPKPYYCYFPFTLGHRSCLGQTFSQMEAKVVMAKLLQRFEFLLVPGQTFKIMDTGTLRPRDGVVCTVKSRVTNCKGNT